MLDDFQNKVWLGMEYFVNEGDEMWNANDEEFKEFATDELLKIKIIESKDNVLDKCLFRVKKAYPAYFDTYANITTLKDYLLSIDNLFCVGRNGQHRYNNMDHSMLTALETVNYILNPEGNDKALIWEVNTEKEYHESKGK